MAFPAFEAIILVLKAELPQQPRADASQVRLHLPLDGKPLAETKVRLSKKDDPLPISRVALKEDRFCIHKNAVENS